MGGAALLGQDGETAWILIDDGEASRLGPAMAWADQAGAGRLHVLVQEQVPGAGAAGIVARRAAEFARPPGVSAVDGRSLSPAEPAPRSRADADEAAAVDDGLVALLAAHGADPVVEHGVLRGEVLGLEVARVISGRLVVGVGRHDRDARAEMRPGEDPGAALDEAVAAVRAWRRTGVARHPANTLARSRWLRSVVCAQPSLVGMGSLEPVPPPLPWFDLPEAGAAPCVGEAQDGGPAVVVCSVGVDLDLVPTAADCRVLYRPGATLVIVVPEGDDLPVTRRLAGALSSPASVLTVPKGWEGLTGGP